MHIVRNYFGIVVRGFCMGIADLVPGVSGGTVAFISGIYSRLLSAISAFTHAALWQDLLTWKIRSVWQRSDAGFLLALAFGILFAVLLFGRLLHYLLTFHAHLLLAFFCGLVLASAVVIVRKIQNFALRHVFIGLLGLVGAASVVSVSSFSVSPSLFVFFIGGSIAICAMLLPGISGSYLLLLAGLYAPVLDALHQRQWLTIIIFAAGCGVGLLCFARLLSAMLRKWHDGMLVFLSGVMLGAMPKLWPWKEQGAGIKTIMQPNILPADYADAQVGWVLTAFIIGMLLTLAADYASTRVHRQDESAHAVQTSQTTQTTQSTQTTQVA